MCNVVKKSLNVTDLKNLENNLISLAHLIGPAILPGLAVPPSQIGLAIQIRKYMTQASSSETCWIWGYNNRHYVGYVGQVQWQGKRYSARRILVKWLTGQDTAHANVKPACQQRWCHNPWHQRITPTKSKIPDRMPDACRKGHPLTDPDSWYWDTNGKGQTFRRCRECIRLRKETGYKYLRKQFKQQAILARSVSHQSHLDSLG